MSVAAASAPLRPGPTRTARPLVLLTTDFKPAFGGIAELLHQLAEAEAARTSVSVYSTVALEGAQWAHAYELHELPDFPKRRLGSRFGDANALLRKVWTAWFFAELRFAGSRAIRRVMAEVDDRAEICVGQWSMETDAWCAALARAGRAYTLMAHGLEIVMPYPDRLSARRRAAFRRAAGIYSNSEGTARLLQDHFGCVRNVRRIRPGIAPVTRPSATADEAQGIRSGLGVDDGFLLLTVGRLVRRKGVDLVLDAMSRLTNELPDLQYIVAGTGPELDALRHRATELGLDNRVTFLGAVDDAARAKLYDVCDAFVMPNRLLDGTDFEGFGLVFLEAALAGKPTIGGDNGGVPDAIQRDVTGLLVDPEDPAELASAIRRLAANPALARRLGEAGRARALRDFSPAAVQTAFAAARDEQEVQRA